MESKTDRVFANDPRFFGKTDSETVQNAIDYASAHGIGKVVIPSENERAGTDVWIIDRAILLPSRLTVELDGARLRLADGVRDNIFRNQNGCTEIGRTVEGEQRDIHIVGKNGATLDGGKPNGMSERLCREHPGEYPSMKVNLLVWFFNVRDFSLEGLRIVESRWWAVCFHFCRQGLLSDLDFRMDASLRNRDGIDLRIGCEDITIRNITGLTGDDTVALSALADVGLDGKLLTVEGKSGDIKNVTIRNLRAASCGCALVRLLNEDGYVLRNIVIDGVEDTGEAISAAAIRFGEGNTRYAANKGREMGEFSDVVVRNVRTSAQYALIFGEPTRNVTVNHVQGTGCCRVLAGFCANFVAENVRLSDLSIRNDSSADCVFFVEKGAETEGCRIENVTVGGAEYLFRGKKTAVSGWRFERETPREHTPESPSFPSAYGLYIRD